jgi:hypothetical protein
MTFELPARFWAKVAGDPSGCWLWTGALSTKGHGRFKVDGKLVSPHRLSYEAHVRNLTAGEVIDHTCHVWEFCDGGPTCLHRRCVNPDHLEPVTLAVNSLRSLHCLTTQNAIKTHCIHGHEFTPANTRRDKRNRWITVGWWAFAITYMCAIGTVAGLLGALWMTRAT